MKLVSIIVPVFNVEKYIRECMNSLIGQTYSNIEIICVDDGSTDSSLSILEEYKEKESRIQLFTQQNKGAGAARNYGLSKAQGEYVYFFDSDDVADVQLIEKTVKRAEETEADVVAFHGYTFTEDDLSQKKKKNGYNQILKEEYGTFSYKDYPNLIFGIVNVVPWNKLIRRKHIVENNLCFEEISSTNDITFAAMCVATAKKVTVLDDILMYYRVGHGGTVSSSKQKNLKNVITAVESVISQAEKLEYFEEIKHALQRFVIDNYSFSFLNYTNDFKTEISEMFYNFVRHRFKTELFADVTVNNIDSRKHYAMFQSIKKHTYEEMLEIRSRDIIISLTSFPARICSVPVVLEMMLTQTKCADKIVLNLAKDQFPNREDDLPEELMELVNTNQVEILWCDEDIRSHKKYYYVMKKYPNSLIITVDDDLKYPLNMVERLYYSYLCYPDCVSAMRTHIIAVDTDGKTILPYEHWIKEYREFVLEPSYQLCATTGAGTLFPPNVLNERVFDKDKFMEICPLADDLWINLMQFCNERPTVCAAVDFTIRILDNTQDISLFAENVEQGKNTVQYNAVKQWLTEEFGYDIIYDVVTRSTGDATYLGGKRIFEYVHCLQEYELSRRRALSLSLKQKEKKIEEIRAKLKQKGKKIEVLQTKLKQKEKIIEELQVKLKQQKSKKRCILYRIARKLFRLFK